MDLGVTIIERETFLSALALTKTLLRGLGLREAEVKRITETFKQQDERRLYRDYQYYTDVEKVRATSPSDGAGRAVRPRYRGAAGRKARETERTPEPVSAPGGDDRG